MPSVLFVCTANQYRSPVAAAYFNMLLRDQQCEQDWLVGSAGTWTISQQPLPSDVVQHAVAIGLNIEGYRTQVVSDYLLESYDLILVMERGHKEAIGIEFPAARERVHLLSEMVDSVPFDIPDPNSSAGQGYRILREMCDLVQRGFPRIKQLAEELSRRRL